MPRRAAARDRREELPRIVVAEAVVRVGVGNLLDAVLQDRGDDGVMQPHASTVTV
ncbi:MAG: hypothetical protein IPH06_13640 [Alphaproteobacteria bacterium]|nr:hypothetical protein [Alphaproteobacteria bacterium]